MPKPEPWGLITLVEDRYHGAYSGGAWIAFRGEVARVNPGGDLEEAFGGDRECILFFEGGDGGPANPAAAEIGRGDTPTDALADLLRRKGEAQG